MAKKLFIPGPTYVRDEILQAQTKPMIGHRAMEYSDLQEAVTPKLQKLLYTEQPVRLCQLGTGDGGAIRQAMLKRALVTVCGPSGALVQLPWPMASPPTGSTFPWARATPEMIDAALSKGDYDALTVTLNETSTG